MKKIKKVLLLFLIIPFFLIKPVQGFELAKNAKSSCLMEMESGKVLYQNNANVELAPASMTKIMTMTIVLDEIKSGNLNWNDMITASKEATSMGGSQIYLKENEKMTVHDMFKSVAIASANDCAYALGERICGTMEQFVLRMNKYANDLGLKNTKFQNPTGLPEENHYSSSYDMAVMARNLLLNHEADITRFTSIYSDYVREESESPFWLVNTNKVIRQDPLVDGLKTGWTEEAGYCITLTKKSDGMRLIAVVMGYQDVKKRNQECYELLSYGFNSYKAYSIFDERVIEEVNDLYYYPNKFKVITNKGLRIVNNEKVNEDDISYQITYDYKNHLERSVGKMEVLYKGFTYQEIPLVLDREIKEANVFQIFKNILREFF